MVMLLVLVEADGDVEHSREACVILVWLRNVDLASKDFEQRTLIDMVIDTIEMVENRC
jgi:hypothetical protein